MQQRLRAVCGSAASQGPSGRHCPDAIYQALRPHADTRGVLRLPQKKEPDAEERMEISEYPDGPRLLAGTLLTPTADRVGAPGRNHRFSFDI